MTLRTPLTARLGIEVPILLAPMAGVSGGRLAAAVSDAGGLGLIGGGYADDEWTTRELEAAGNTPVGVGFITWALAANPVLLDSVLQRAPRALMFSFGDFAPFASRVQSAGIPIIAQVQDVAGARAAVSAGADIIVAQGTEAGGHGGARATLPLVPAVVDAVGDIPVVAAGGIADGRGLSAALMLGASGVLCGTAFYASNEALTHPAAKRAALAASGDATLRGSVFDVARGLDWPPQWNLRTLANRFSRRWHDDLDTLRGTIDNEARGYHRAVADGDTNIAPVIVGEAVDLLRAEQGAGAIVVRMLAEAEQRLHAGMALIQPTTL